LFDSNVYFEQIGRPMLMNRLVLLCAYDVLQEAVYKDPVKFSCREWFYVHMHPQLHCIVNIFCTWPMLMNRLVLLCAYDVLQEAVYKDPVKFSCREWFYVHMHPQLHCIVNIFCDCLFA
jgi:hypothetical protein